MIKVTHLTKKYGDYTAVNDISFEIENGHVYGFLGPNGAGKSSTMNMITGYLAPTKGTILVNDISMMKQPEKAKGFIGYLPETPPLYQDMTVMEYLKFAAELKGVPKYDRLDHIKKIIEQVKLEDKEDRLIKNLSKGYKQRVGLAQALLSDPEIIVLDEPTVGLDPKQIVEIRDLIKKLGKEHTVILSTHILSEVSAVCDRVIIISGGKIAADDDIDHLVEKYNEKQILTLVVKGSSSRAEKVLDKIEGIEEKAVLKENTNFCTISITAKPGKDIREEISVTCSGSGLTILELNAHNISFEDVYLKLTSEDYNDNEPGEGRLEFIVNESGEVQAEHISNESEEGQEE